MKTANTRQVGGNHYQNQIQHRDWVFSNGLDYFQGQITKYVARWRHKNGIEDLEKALHFLEKYIELQKEENAMADVTINITGVSTNTTVDASGGNTNEPRYHVIDSNDVIIGSYETVTQAREFVKASGSDYKIIDISPEAGVSYVDQG